LAADVTGFLHIIDVTTTAEIDQFHETVLHSKIAVTEQQVNDFIEECKIIDDLWDLYSSRFDSQTIYYEDCDKSISLLHLAIDDIPYAYGENQYGECLPAYKKEMFTNIDEVQCWMTRYYD
jgi:hypothetical protein